MNRICKLTALIAALFIFNLQASLAQPKYLVQISRTAIDELPIPSNVNTPSTILLGSDDGSFFYNIGTSGYGMATDNVYQSSVADILSVYIRGNPTGNIPYRFIRTLNGELTAGSLAVGNYGFASFPTTSNLSDQPTTGYNTNDPSTPLWVYAPTRYTPSTGSFSINHLLVLSGTTNNVANTFPAYPGTNYYSLPSSGGTMRARVRRKFYTSAGNPFVSNSGNVFGDIDVNYNLQVASQTLVPRRRRLGKMRGITKKYTCGGPGSGASAEPGPGAMSLPDGSENGSDDLLTIYQNLN